MKNLLIAVLCIFSMEAFTQVVDEETKRKFTFGLDVFSDIWQDVPETLDPKTLNTGVNIFGSYNYIFGNSNVSFSPGLGLSVHNLYSDSFLENDVDTVYFVKIPEEVGYKKSKLTDT